MVLTVIRGRAEVGSGDTFTNWTILDFQVYQTATAANVAVAWTHDLGGFMVHDLGGRAGVAYNPIYPTYNNISDRSKGSSLRRIPPRRLGDFQNSPVVMLTTGLLYTPQGTDRTGRGLRVCQSDDFLSCDGG